MKKKVSTSSPTGSPTRKPVTTGKRLPRVALADPSAMPIFITHRNQQAEPPATPKPLIYMALGRSQ